MEWNPGQFALFLRRARSVHAAQGRSFFCSQGSDLNDFRPDRRGRDIRREFVTSWKTSQSRACSRSAKGATFTWNRPGQAGRRLRKRARSRRTRKQKSSFDEIEETKCLAQRLALLSTMTRRPWPLRSLNALCGWFVLTSPAALRRQINPELMADFIIRKELRRKTRSLAIRIRTRCGGSTCFTPQGACDRGAVRRDGIANHRSNQWGHGRVLFTVASYSFCRENVHRFGFETFRKLADAGRKLVDDGTAVIADVARA